MKSKITSFEDLGISIEEYNSFKCNFITKLILDMRFGVNGYSKMTFKQISILLEQPYSFIRSRFFEASTAIAVSTVSPRTPAKVKEEQDLHKLADYLIYTDKNLDSNKVLSYVKQISEACSDILTFQQQQELFLNNIAYTLGYENSYNHN